MKKWGLLLIPVLFLTSCTVNDESMYTVYMGNRKFTELQWVKAGLTYDEFVKLDGSKVRFKGNYIIVEEIN